MENEIISSNFNGIYEDIADYLGIDMAVKFYERYRGQQITFPVRLYTTKYVVNQISQDTGEGDIKDIARKYGYTEQWIRRMLKTSLNFNNSK